jgi:hypothetical protein
MTENTQDINKLFRKEFPDLFANLIWKNDAGEYEVFDRYVISPEKHGYRVYCSATDVGLFSTTKTALSWCIADKYTHYNLARDILTLDNKLSSLISDISTRANLADRSKQPLFRETIETKLETKIIHKKQVEQELTKCVNYAKYCQQRGFNNETVRTGNNKAIKASR